MITYFNRVPPDVRLATTNELARLLKSKDTGARQKQYVVTELAKRSVDNNTHQSIREAHCIGSLVSISISHIDPHTQHQARLTLLSLGANIENQEALINENGITAFVSILGSDENDLMKENAILVLINLATSDNGIGSLISLFDSPDAELRQFAVLTLARLTINTTHHDKIRNANGIIKLISLLNSDFDVKTQQYIVRCLSNLSNSYVNQSIILEARGIQAIMLLLNSHDLLTQRYATLAIANLAVNDKNRTAIRQSPGFKTLKSLINSTDEETKHEAQTIMRCLRPPASAASISPRAAIFHQPPSRNSDEKSNHKYAKYR